MTKQITLITSALLLVNVLAWWINTETGCLVSAATCGLLSLLVNDDGAGHPY